MDPRSFSFKLHKDLNLFVAYRGIIGLKWLYMVAEDTERAEEMVKKSGINYLGLQRIGIGFHDDLSSCLAEIYA